MVGLGFVWDLGNTAVEFMWDLWGTWLGLLELLKKIKKEEVPQHIPIRMNPVSFIQTLITQKYG